MRAPLALLLCYLLNFSLFANSSTFFITDSLSFGQLEGTVYDQATKTPISFATVQLVNMVKGEFTDDNGHFSINQIPSGRYTVEVSFLGYELKRQQVTIQANQPQYLAFYLETAAVQLQMVEVRPDYVVTKLQQQETKLSKDFIANVPSGDDIMQVMEIVPGVSSPPGFNNDLNVRGGASFENKYLVDGLEIPIINHFASTGTNSGFRSILHHKTIKNATLHTSALPINIGNATSSVFDFQLIGGNTNVVKKTFSASTTDATLLLEGPLAKNADFVLSFRQAYLKPTLTLLRRPILSNYNDWLYKFRWKKDKHILTLLGLGSSDGITENFNAPSSPLNQYLLSRLNSESSWHTFSALKYQHLRQSGYTSLHVAGYFIRHQLSKEESSPSALFSSRKSDKQRREFRINLENVQKWKGLDFRTGFQASTFNYFLDSKINWRNQDQLGGTVYSDVSIFSWNAFVQLQRLTDNRFFWSIGARIDTDNYTKTAPFKQFSPRLSLAYRLNEQQSIHLNVAQYHQLPPAIAMVSRNDNQELVNQKTLDYLSTKQLTLGWTFSKKDQPNLWKVELFYKDYDNYLTDGTTQLPFSARGHGFATFFSEHFASDSEARARGLEITWHPKWSGGYYSYASYTLGKSEFKNNLNGLWQPTNFDARHILNVTGGKRMKHGWHIGLVARLQSGVPYTPWDIDQSSEIVVWANTLNVGVLDYKKVNTNRTATSATLDLKIDKAFTLKRVTIKTYLDILNLPISGSTLGRPLLTNQVDELGVSIMDANHPEQLLLQQIDNNLSSMIPSLGLNVVF
ncbi:MAG: TonB-dependent receptor [Bacteroidota bacterium]